MKSYLLLCSLILAVTLMSCNDNDEDSNEIDNPSNQLPPGSACDLPTIISKEDFNQAESDPFTLTSVEINGDCLEVTFGASGCDGDSWEMKLIDSDEVMESAPPQRSLVFTLSNEEACLAFFSKTVSFDLTSIQTEGDEVILHIENVTTEGLHYKY